MYNSRNIVFLNTGNNLNGISNSSGSNYLCESSSFQNIY